MHTLVLQDIAPALAPPSAVAHPLWQHQLGLLLESTGEGIFGIDLAGHCMFINRAGALMLGYEPAQVLGHNMHELTHHSHADGSHYADTECPIFNAFRRGLPCRIDTEVFWRHDRTSFATEYSSYPIMDGERVLGAVITFVDITQRKQAADALRRAKEELELRVVDRTHELSVALGQLRELSAYSEKVREDERTRIAREVHDELGSLLVALKMDVNWLDKRIGEMDPASTLAALSTEASAQDTQTQAMQTQATPTQDMQTRMRSKCRSMSRQIESAVDNVGRIINDLRPSIFDHQGLWAALEWQADEFVQSAELSLDWDMRVEGAPELPEATAMAVFRIFQEMLSNVGRHAQAKHLAVGIHVAQGQLTVRVTDDGRGAPAAAFEAPTAYGVMGMHERARHMGGQINIQSQLGVGSTFELCMPVPV
jgi:PAS domain S-box-containing protein